MTLREKHRPETLQDIVGQPVDEIHSVLQDGDTPNFLFYGPPGTGKTTTARAIARELHGTTDNLYEINASDARGIEMIRDQITEIARLDTGVQLTLDMHTPIVLLDECDSMTTDAQHALRSPMEDTQATFILTANDVDALHDALVSRCFAGGHHFDYLSTSAVLDRLETVVESEGIDVNEDRLIGFANRSNGDMRTALDLLERHQRFAAPANADPDEEQIQEVKEFIEGTD